MGRTQWLIVGLRSFAVGNYVIFYQHYVHRNQHLPGATQCKPQPLAMVIDSQLLFAPFGSTAGSSEEFCIDNAGFLDSAGSGQS